MKKTKTTLGIILSIGCIALVMTASMQSCKKSDSSTSPTTATTKTLYDSLGGTALVNDPAHSGTMIEKGRLGIRSVVDSTIFVIAADTAINGFFTTLLTELSKGNTSGFMALEKNLTDFFCVATGAKDYTYTGKNMSDAHNPNVNPRINGKADNHDFDVFVNDLVKGATKVGLSSQQIGRVGTIVNTTRSQVVQK